MNSPRFWFLAALALIAALSRVVPHPLNFAPLAAVALFGAATSSSRWTGAVIGFGSLLLSNLFLQLTYQPNGWQPYPGFYPGQWVIYACLLPTLFLGFAIRGRRTPAIIAVAAFTNSVVFFAATNFAVWAYGSGVTYPKNTQGLLLCYEMAIPFFKNSLLGDAFYTTVLFGSLAVAESRIRGISSVKVTASVPLETTT